MLHKSALALKFSCIYIIGSQSGLGGSHIPTPKVTFVHVGKHFWLSQLRGKGTLGI
jgi:hypothetical protein